jgi:hypothetical protein
MLLFLSSNNGERAKAKLIDKKKFRPLRVIISHPGAYLVSFV